MLNNEKLLNHRQRQILEYIRSCVHQNGYPPSIREICSSVGLSSTATVYSHLKSLEENGLIRRGSSKNRTMSCSMKVRGGQKKLFPSLSSARCAPAFPFWRKKLLKMSTPFLPNLSAMTTALC